MFLLKNIKIFMKRYLKFKENTIIRILFTLLKLCGMVWVKSMKVGVILYEKIEILVDFIGCAHCRRGN